MGPGRGLMKEAAAARVAWGLLLRMRATRAAASPHAALTGALHKVPSAAVARPTCSKILIRSTGAVIVRAMAPEMPPARNITAVLGTRCSAASGRCFSR